MTTFQVDLSNCDREPIHIPGKIQSHGFLIALDQENTIRYYSDNLISFIPGIFDDILGKPLQYIEDLLTPDDGHRFILKLINLGTGRKSFERTNPVPVTIAGIPFYLIISTNNGFHLIEFEPSASNFDLDVQSMMGRSISEILSYRNIQQLLDHSASQVRDIIQFDRVMIYRFAEDGHGEVVAEAKNKKLPPWLGLHYPASDIPKQARELYKLNLTRLIADVNAVSSPISTAADTYSDLDLTHSQLRAVSPIHIQYLKNMGVASSFSISLKYKDELWGLIACHNYTPSFIDFKSREYSKLVGQILSSALEFRQDEKTQQAQEISKLNLDKLAKQLQGNDSIEIALTAKSVNLLDIIKASGAILAYDKKLHKLGVTPDDEQLLQLFRWINDTVKDPVFYTASLLADYPEAAAYKDVASGILVAVLSRELGDYLVWFKPEQITVMNWAGHPEKSLEINANGLMQISPRKSFEVWTETIFGIAASWNSTEINAAVKLREEINYGINLKAGAMRLMNERLRQAYEELEAFSYTISHDLKNPIASIKSYAQLLMRDQAVLERGQQMLQRIADRADQMNLMINAVLNYSRIGRSSMVYRVINTGTLIAEIIKDLELIYDVSNISITVGELPEMNGDPIMILQVFSNLISNAVKYSKTADPAMIHIEGLKSKKGVQYSVRDNGMGIAKRDIPKIFELFNRMENVKDIEGSGVGLAIVKRIVEKHQGNIWAESELGKGSVFYLAFNN